MRLGGTVFGNQTPEAWIDYLKQEGYRAAVFPVNHEADKALRNEYVQLAHTNDIVIAEVGAWSNPISLDETERKQALDLCKKQLELAEQVGANCCVNIAGSRGLKWDGPDVANFTDDTFALIVDSVREIIDEVNPKRTYYTLETMPWIFPDTTESYLQLIKAIDRKGFAVHYDPVNMITSPRAYYNNGQLIREFVAKLGPYIKSCHVKDIALSTTYTVHLDEVVPGSGNLEYRVLLKELQQLDREMPLLLEHYTKEEEYRTGAAYIRGIASELGVEL